MGRAFKSLVLVLLLMAAAPRIVFAAPADMRFGMGGSLYPDVRQAEDGELIAMQRTRELDRLGMVWLRHPGKGIAWHEIQPTRGTWDFSKLDAVLMENNHPWIFPVYGMVGNAYPFNADFSPEYLAGLSREEILQHIIENAVDMDDPQQRADAEVFVRTLVGRYKDRVKYWEIGGNEGISSPERLGIITHTYGWIKDVDPDAKVMVTAVCGDDDYLYAKNLLALDALLAAGAGDYFDIANTHYYGKTGSGLEARLAERFDQYKAVLDKYGVNKPIWVTETSTSSHPSDALSGDSSIALQAQDMVKRLAVFSARGADKVFWYNYRELEPGDKFYGCNIYHSQTEAKPAYHVFRMMVEKIGFFQRAEDLSDGGVWLYRFTTGAGRGVWAAWSGEARDADLSPHLGGKKALVTYIPQAQGGRINEETRPTDDIRLGPAPVIIELAN